MALIYDCDKAEFMLQLMQGNKEKKSLGDLAVGQKVNKQFPHDIDGQFMSVIVEGEIETLVETTDAGYAKIRDSKNDVHWVCLG